MSPENQPRPEQTLEEMFGPEKAAQMRREAEKFDRATSDHRPEEK